MKKLSLLFAAIITILIGQASFAEDMAKYRIVPNLPQNAQEIVNKVFGEGIFDLSTYDGIERFHDYIIEDGVIRRSLNWNPQFGWFAMEKGATLPREYYVEGVYGIPGYGATPSQEPGKFTPEEAAAMALDYLVSIFEIEPTTLVVDKIFANEPLKERSRVYEIDYHYVLEGIEVYPHPADLKFHVTITDNGVEFLSGKIATFEYVEPVAADTIFAPEAMRDKIAQEDAHLATWEYELVYAPIRTGDDYFLIPAYKQVTEAGNPFVFDAVTGESLSR